MPEINVTADVAGMIWKILVKEGDVVEEDMPVAIIESMKMEIPVVSSEEGMVTGILVKEGDRITEGDVIVILKS